MRHKILKLIVPALAAALALNACVQAPPNEASGAPTGSGQTENAEVTRPAPLPQGSSGTADALFSITYDSAASLNPLTGRNAYNNQLFSLLYEGLFVLSPDLEPEKVLCENFTVTEGKLYHIELKSGVLFHDGTPLTSGDVAATLRAAMRSQKYAQRLSDIESVTESGGTAVDIRLKRANTLLPALLDIPILKAGELDADAPAGTGPYRLSGDRLTVFPSHREYRPESLRTIYLREIPESSLAEAFSERVIDLVDYDPNGSGVLHVHMVHDRRCYDTSRLVYLGFNTSAAVVSDRLVRRALMSLVDREAVSGEIYAGAARPSVFVLSPALGLYDAEDTAGYGYSRETFYRLAVMAGLEGTDEDGYLNYNGAPFALTLLVNSDSPVRLEAAERIAADMASAGIRVEVSSLPYAQYLSALEDGEFDLYVGEVMLRADLDLTALFSGPLNYSRLGDERYGALMDAYLAAPEERRREAARALDVFVAEDAAIVPILYKERAVLTHMGVVSGADPSQSGPFGGILGWSFDLQRG